MSRARNPNLDVVRHAARALGGAVLAVRKGKKHLRVELRTPSGAIVHMALSQGRNDPYKLKGWVRQKMNEGGQ